MRDVRTLRSRWLRSAYLILFGVAGMRCVDALDLDRWSAHLLDDDLAWRALFITPADLDGDGLLDIALGGWWYRNPGAPDGQWEARVIGEPLNNLALVYDFDADGDLDVLGTPGRNEGDTTPDSPKLVWAENDGSGSFSIHDDLPIGQGPFIAGTALARFQSGGPLQVAISWNGGESGRSGIQLLTVPDDPRAEPWTIEEIHPVSEGEGLTAGDIDGDGDLDLFQGSLWLRNDGDSWTQFRAATFASHVDRNRLADFDGDGDLDAVVGFLFGKTPLHWLEAPDDPTDPWTVHTIASRIGGGLSIDVADMDGDGDIDVIHGEHRDATRLIVYESSAAASEWTPHLVHPGGSDIDHHDGAVTVDIDGDGDLDILSTGWFHPKVWLFENRSDAPANDVAFRRGDTNSDGIFDISDPVRTLLFLFLGAQPPLCLATADSDADGQLGLSDPILALDRLFRGGDPLAPPYPDCGIVEELTLPCVEYPACE